LAHKGPLKPLDFLITSVEEGLRILGSLGWMVPEGALAASLGQCSFPG